MNVSARDLPTDKNRTYSSWLICRKLTEVYYCLIIWSYLKFLNLPSYDLLLVFILRVEIS
jgi:hypothetical protein